MPEKIYAPITVKEVTTKYGPLLKVSFRADALAQFAEQHKNAKGYINLAVSKRKEVGQYGDTHSATLDTWEPKQGGQVRTQDDSQIPY